MIHNFLNFQGIKTFSTKMKFIKLIKINILIRLIIIKIIKINIYFKIQILIKKVLIINKIEKTFKHYHKINQFKITANNNLKKVSFNFKIYKQSIQSLNYNF